MFAGGGGVVACGGSGAQKKKKKRFLQINSVKCGQKEKDVVIYNLFHLFQKRVENSFTIITKT